MTVAQKIARQFDNDPQCWEKKLNKDDEKETYLVDLCAESPHFAELRILDNEQIVRYTFDDDSTITMFEEGWVAGPVEV